MLYNMRHKTYPTLAHAPSYPQCNPLWKALNQSISALPLLTRLPDEVSIVTFNNGVVHNKSMFNNEDYDKPLGVLEKQLSQLNVPHTVLGRNVPPPWQHRQKMYLLAEHLEHESKPYVLVADSADVFVLNKLEPLLERFLAFQCETLVSRDPFLWPKALVEWSNFETSVCPDTWAGHLCAGLWMTKRDFGKELMAYCIALDENYLKNGFPPGFLNGDDQQYLHLSFKTFYPKIQIDYKCSVFQTVVGPDIGQYVRLMRMF